jgi:nucleoside-diphosphate-sugar epimerase
MIIGNGLLASAFMLNFANDANVTIFASGVSNSRETSLDAFARERAMLLTALAQAQAHNTLILYFSTCSVHDLELEESPYVKHKIDMENLVRDCPRFAIFRLPQVVGHTPNPNTLTNYLHRQIRSGAPFQIWLHASRNLIDVSDVANIVTHLVHTHQADGVVTNIACPFSVPVIELVKTFEAVLDQRAHYSTVEAGGHYFIDASLGLSVANQIGIVFDDHYIPNLIRKYYA